MKLISIESAKSTNDFGWLDLILTADLEEGNGEEILPFTYSPTDKYGLAPQVRDYLAAHPELQITKGD